MLIIQGKNGETIKPGRAYSATVTFFHRRDQYGFAVIDDLEIAVRFQAATGPVFIDAGLDAPQFSKRFHSSFPEPGNRIKLEVKPKSLNEAECWSAEKDWLSTELEISRQPIFRIYAENAFLDEKMSTSNTESKTPVFEGTLEQMIAISPRDGLRESTTDKFAPKYKVGPCSTYSRFTKLNVATQQWERSNDPRPFPDGTMYRLMQWVKGQKRQIAWGTKLELEFKFPRGAAKDPLRQLKSKGESRGYRYWEVRENMVAKSDGKCKTDNGIVIAKGPAKKLPSFWVETSDPRAVSEQKRPIATAKSAKPATKQVNVPETPVRKLFTQVAGKSFEELAAYQGPLAKPVETVFATA